MTKSDLTRFGRHFEWSIALGSTENDLREFTIGIWESLQVVKTVRVYNRCAKNHGKTGTKVFCTRP